MKSGNIYANEKETGKKQLIQTEHKPDITSPFLKGMSLMRTTP